MPIRLVKLPFFGKICKKVSVFERGIFSKQSFQPLLGNVRGRVNANTCLLPTDLLTPLIVAGVLTK
jgi:hypothetical protein